MLMTQKLMSLKVDNESCCKKIYSTSLVHCRIDLSHDIANYKECLKRLFSKPAMPRLMYKHPGI